MSLPRIKLKRIGLATDIPRGRGIWIGSPSTYTGTYTGGGGEYGAQIIDEDRTFAVTREPVAYRVVFTVAHDVFDNWFELQIEGDEKGEKSEAFDKQVQEELMRLEAKRELTRMAVFERTYGWAILVLGYTDKAEYLSEPVDNAQSIDDIKAYSPTQITKVDGDKRQTLDGNKPNKHYGMPQIYHIKLPGVAASLKVHYTRVIHFATRWVDPKKAEWKGQSVLDQIWDDLVTLRNIRWGMGQTMYRYGSGFPDITFKGVTKEQIDDWIDSGEFSALSARTAFIHGEEQEIDFKGLQGRALNPEPYYKAIIENLSCGTGIPEAILRGVQAGALTGSEVNQQEYYGVISDEQSAYESGIRELIEIILRFKKTKANAEANPKADAEPLAFKFNWKSGIELPEERKTTIEKTKVDTIMALGPILTRNELRAQYDPELEELSEEQGGNEVLGRSPTPELGASQFHVKPHSDGSHTVTELSKRHSLAQYR